MPVLTMAAQRAALAALLDTLPGITGGLGRVHTRRRIVRDENAIRQLLVGPNSPDGKVNAWMIYPAAANTTVTQRHPGHHGIGIQGGGNVMTTFQWAIDAYGAIDDSDEARSEETFQDLAWSVADTLNSYGLLAITGLVMQLPADIEQFGYVMLGNFAFYHYARIGVGFQGRTRPV
jgi:hypothetical protein